MRTSWMLALGLVTAAMAGRSALAEVVIEAREAAIRTEGAPHPAGGWNLWSSGRVGQPFQITEPGDYRVVVRAWGSPAGGVWPEMGLMVDGRVVQTVTVGGREPADYAFELKLAPGVHELAAGFLNDAVIGSEDRNLFLDRLVIAAPAGVSAPTPVGKSELAATTEAREREVLAGTEEAIDKHRKGDVVLRVVDAAGNPVRGARVTVEQTGHDFLFGCNLYMLDRYPDEARNAAYRQRFEDLFNYATIGFYWKSYEPKRGEPNYAYTDKVVAWCRARGIAMKGHPLLWGHPAGVPPWSPGQPAADIQRRRVEDILNRYGKEIRFWEVVNEPAHIAEPKIDEPYRWARQADPSAYLIINDYQVLSDGCPPFFELLTNAKQAGVPFDGIGIQAHEPRTMRFPLDRVQEILDQYATLGKELHITEFTPSSSGDRMTGSYREGVWDEAAQADYAVKFYRVCFAHPSMRAITWWDLSDLGAWLRGGGMLRADMTPKPVYERLKRLIHEEWHTRATATTDSDGRFAFRGFFGEYHLTVELPDGEVKRTFRLGKDAPSEVVVSLKGKR